MSDKEKSSKKVDSVATIRLTETENLDAKWYVVHTISGQEKKAAITLGERVRTLNLQDQINEILIPTQKKVVMTSGKKREVTERLFPGYMLVLAEIDDYVWQTIRATPGVTGFVGADNKPTPISKKEVESIKAYMKVDTPKYEVKFSEGDAVKITDGAFKDVMGKVSKVIPDQGRIEVLISVFDREAPVEVDLNQVDAV